MRRLYADQSRKLYDELLEVFAKMAADSADGKIYLNDLYRTDSFNRLLEYFNMCAKDLGAQQVVITEDTLVRA